MALTSETKTDLYRFFSIAFNAAPGVTYMNQLAEASNAGMTVAEIVEVFTGKSQFTSVYPLFLTDDEFATKLVDNVVGSSASAAAKAEAVADIAAALGAGWSKGKVIYTIFNNLANKAADDATWGGTATQMANKVAVAKYYTETLLRDTTDLPTLQGVIANVTNATDTSAAAIEAVLNPPANLSFTLTAGVDSFTGGAGNDTVTGLVSGSLSALDALNGGAGSDTLNVTDTAAIMVPTSVKVANVETANLVSGAAITVDASGWTGLTQLTTSGSGAATVAAGTGAAIVTTTGSQADKAVVVDGGATVTVSASGATTGAVKVGGSTAPTGAVSVSRTTTGSVNAGEISVTGGTTVSVTQTASAVPVNSTATNGTVTVTGGASTTAVTVTAPKEALAGKNASGINANSVTVTDVNAASATKGGTITTVAVDGYNGLFISGTAVTNLGAANGKGNIIIDNSGLTTATNKTLALAINGVTSGTLDDADIYTTLNITTSGANSTLSNITFGGATALTVAGTKALTLTSAAGMTKLKAVTVSGAAGIKADLSGATVTVVDTSGTTGASTVTIDASKATFTGGAGVDTVTLAATAPTKAINLGDGNDTLDITSATAVTTAVAAGGAGTDTLKMTAALAATGSATTAFAKVVSGFESLVLTGATNQTIDLAVLGGYSTVSTSGGNGLTLNNLPSGGSLKLTGAGTAYTVSNAAFAVPGSTDTLNLTLADGSGAGVAFASTGITASGVETVAIATVDSQDEPTGTFNDSVTLLGNSVQTISASGNAGLALTASSTALTNVDASGITLGGFTWTSGALAAASTVKGSATGANAVTVSAATAAVAYTGGTGADAVTAANAKSNSAALGDGANTFTGGNGNNTVTAGKGADIVTVGNGNNTVSLGDGANAFTAGNGNNTYVGGAGVDTIVVGGGVNTITTGAGADTVTLSGAGANVNTYSTITDATKGDTIVLKDLGTEVFGSAKVTLAATAVFQDYANAVVQAGGNASVNAYIGWFQFNGDTYVVESNHDGSGVNASFVNGTDYIIKLTGLIDLSKATVTGNSITLGDGGP